jgi:hypothetical protein
MTDKVIGISLQLNRVEYRELCQLADESGESFDAIFVRFLEELLDRLGKTAIFLYN